MSTTLRCMLVDDEALARHRFRSLLEQCHCEREIEVVAEAQKGSEAIPLIYELKPEVVFLDIQMPGLSGFDVVDLLSATRPHIVFVSAYDEFALKAFEVHALDYLTKPVSKDRLERTLERVHSSQYQIQQSKAIEALRTDRASMPLPRLTVHHGNKLRVVQRSEIRRIEAEDKVVRVFLADGTYTTDFSLDVLELRLGQEEFIRIHRSHIVRIDAVRELIPWFSGSYCLKLDDGSQLPVARRRAATIKALFGGRTE